MSMEQQQKDRKKEKLLELSKEELVKMILDQEKQISVQHDMLKKLLAENETLRQQLQKQEDEQNEDGYHSTSSWISKIVFTLRQENRPLRSLDLIKRLEKREPSLAEHKNKVQYFSAFLSNAVKYGRIIQQKVKGVRGYYYLLPYWLDETMKVKPEYEKLML